MKKVIYSCLSGLLFFAAVAVMALIVKEIPRLIVGGAWIDNQTILLVCTMVFVLITLAALFVRYAFAEVKSKNIINRVYAVYATAMLLPYVFFFVYGFFIRKGQNPSAPAELIPFRSIFNSIYSILSGDVFVPTGLPYLLQYLLLFVPLAIAGWFFFQKMRKFPVYFTVLFLLICIVNVAQWLSASSVHVDNVILSTVGIIMIYYVMDHFVLRFASRAV